MADPRPMGVLCEVDTRPRARLLHLKEFVESLHRDHLRIKIMAEGLDTDAATNGKILGCDRQKEAEVNEKAEEAGVVVRVNAVILLVHRDHLLEVRQADRDREVHDLRGGETVADDGEVAPHPTHLRLDPEVDRRRQKESRGEMPTIAGRRVRETPERLAMQHRCKSD